DLTLFKYRDLARQYYNAFKHLTKRDGSSRDDDLLLSDFRDEHNDALLFIAWTDFIAASPCAPIEAQVFQVWFYASHPDKMAKREDANRFLSAFPRLKGLPRAVQKIELKKQIAIARANSAVMADPRTDKHPLIFRR